MVESSDMELLREYVERGVEKAFTTVVSRHLQLVYHSALRQTRLPEVAEEITQTVFTLLARKAARLSSGTIVAGWLVKTTRFVSMCALRDDARRKRREEEVSRVNLNEGNPGLPDRMENILPILDQTLADLRAADRDVLVLRYLEGRSFGEVARALGSSEEAARKRVQRALERLRGLLGQRGVAIGSAVLAAGLGATSAQAAELSAGVIGASAVKQAASVDGLSLLTRTSLEAMKTMQWKAAAAIAGAILLAALTTGAVLNHRSSSTADGRAAITPAPESTPLSAPSKQPEAAPLAVATRKVSVRIVDEKGAPIPEAVIEFAWGIVEGFSTGVKERGVRPGRRVPLYMTGMEEISHADANGVIELQLPEPPLNSWRIDSIVASVRAPGYVSVDARITLAKPERVTMVRGGTLRVRVTGVNGRSQHPYALVEMYQPDKRAALDFGLMWMRRPGGVLETHLPKENYVVMGVDTSEGGPRFSRARILQAEGAGTREIELRTTPGRRAYGRLDDSVPRPVFGGRVIACALSPAMEDADVKTSWETSCDIAADGTFDLGRVPEGELQLVAFCQGYVSLPDMGRSVVLVTPQGFPAGTPMPLVVRMIQDASLRVTVRDTNGRPVAGAEVSIQVNQNLDGFSASDYRSSYMETPVILQNRQDAISPLRSWLLKGSLRETTDLQGIAAFENLPIYQARIDAEAKGMERISKGNVQIESGDNSLEVTLKAAPAP